MCAPLQHGRLASRKDHTILALPGPVYGAGQANNHKGLARGQQGNAGEGVQVALDERADRRQCIGSSEEVCELQRQHAVETDLNPGEQILEISQGLHVITSNRGGALLKYHDCNNT